MQYMTTGSVGNLLQEARLRQGYDLRLIADDLNIRYQYLLAIEDGRYEDLPGPTYAVGFIRTYADYLGLPNEDVLRRFREEMQEHSNGTARLQFPTAASDGGIPAGAFLLVALIVAGCAYGVWFWLSSNNKTLADLIPAVPVVISEWVDNWTGAPATPEDSTPEESGGTTPEKTTPETTTPGQTAPETTAPETAAPGIEATGTEATGTEATGTPTASTSPTLDPLADQTPEAPAAPTETRGTSTAAPGDHPEEPRPGASNSLEALLDAPSVDDSSLDAPSSGIQDETDEPAEATPRETALPDGPPPVTEPAPPSDPLAGGSGSADMTPPEPPETAQPLPAPLPNGETVAATNSGVAPPMEAAPGTDTEADPEPALAAPEVPDIPETDDGAATDEVGPDETPAATEEDTTEEPEPAYVDREAPADVRAAAGESRIVFLARRDAWIQLRKNGNLVIRRLLRRGDVYAVPPDGGYELYTSNAGGLEVYVDGRRVRDLGPLGAPRSGVRLSPGSL